MRGPWTAAAIAAATLVVGGTAQAKTFDVTRANDPNPGRCKANDCSLREALLAANARQGKDKIVLPGRRYSLTRPGSEEDLGESGDLDVTGPLSLSHPGKGSAKIDASELDRVLHVFENANTALSKIIATDGLLEADGEDGGGVLTGSDLALRNSSVKGNSATGIDADGGGIDLDGDAKLTLKRSAVVGNDVTGNGGGMNGSGGGMVITSSRVSGNEAGGEGGGIDTLTDETVRITRSRIESNEAGGVGGGIEGAAAALALKQSTVAGNTAAGNGGGIAKDDAGTITVTASTINGNTTALRGGGIYAAVNALNVVNSTIAGNQSDENGGGIDAENTADVSLNAVTIARNIANADAPLAPALQGGGIYQIDSTVELRNTIIALNAVGVSGIAANDCEGDTFLSLGNNLLSTENAGECEGFTQPTDIEDPAPGLAQLKPNGGPTKTVALKAGSPAIGEADNGSAPPRDQRGRKRDNQPDIGAFERGA